jgi:hypothetical protein
MIGRAVAVALLATLVQSPSLAAGDDAMHAAKKPYVVVNGKVDQSTYLGWRAYHSACHTCHGVDATGTSVAPSLVERMKKLSARDFSFKVLTSYRIVLGAGSTSGDDSTAVREAMLEEVLRRDRGELVMPAWERDPAVRPHLMDLYAYLKARADGALGPGEPRRLDR